MVNPCAAGWITGLGQFEKRRVKFAIFLSVLSSLHVVLSSLHVVLSSLHVALSSLHVARSPLHLAALPPDVRKGSAFPGLDAF